MTHFDYAHLIEEASHPGKTGGTVYNQGIDPEIDHFIVGGVATMTFPLYVWRGFTWPTRANLLSTFIESFEDRHQNIYNIWADTLGFWIDRGNIYWDLGTVHTDLIPALEIASHRKERFIYDTATQAAIPV